MKENTLFSENIFICPHFTRMGKNKQSTHEVVRDPNNDILLPVC